MSLDDLDRAVELRRQQAATAGGGSGGEQHTSASASTASITNTNGNGKRTADNDNHDPESNFLASQAETSYLLLSHSSTGGTSSLAESSDYQRTGRWTDEETALVDCLIQGFDLGQFAIPEGMRLNDFLRDLLLCKSSRLTKKMKHARLSSRCYELLPTATTTSTTTTTTAAPLPHPGSGGVNPRVLSALEDEFLKSIASPPSRLELKFNFCKIWRSALSNLCVQVASPLLVPDDWIASLEIMEKKAIEAEEAIRTARRHRMGLALKTDLRSTQSGVYFSGVSVQQQRRDASAATAKRPRETTATAAAVASVALTPSAPNGINLQHHHHHHPPAYVEVPSSASVQYSEDGDAEFISNMLDLTHPSHSGGGISHRHRSDSFDDFSKVFQELSGDSTTATHHHLRNNCGPFLEAIAMLIETHNLPFEHVDVWVPSADPSSALMSNNAVGGPESKLRLYHAGYATRHDLDPVLTRQLDEYGEYSTKFSFAMGVGLPGRVFEVGGHSWERRIDQANPKLFERAGGARVYGIKTGLGISVSTNVIGRMVVALYSTRDLEEDERVVQLCTQEFAKFSPEPKWTLVVEMGPTPVPPVLPLPESDPMALAAAAAAATAPTTTERDTALTTFTSASGIDHYHHHHHYSSDQQALHQKLPPQENFQLLPSSSAGGAASSSSVSSSPDPGMDCRIAMLLGDHIPLSDGPVNDPSVHGTALTSVSDFMSLRLMLLRAPSRRTEQENDMIEIIKKSYDGYSMDHRRTPKQIAYLLVTDWVYLNGKTDPINAIGGAADQKLPALGGAAGDTSTYQSHVMEAGALPAGNVAPMRMPPSFAGEPRNAVRRGSSFDLVLTSNSHPSGPAMAVPESHNIVDDNSEGNS